MTNRAWCLVQRPTEFFKESDIELRDFPRPQPDEGQLLIRTVYMSIDPAYRVWMNDVELYLPALQLGDRLRGSTIGVVEESRHPAYKPGDIVAGLLYLQEYHLSDGSDIMPVPPGIPLRPYYALYGHIGTTAYFGLEIVHPRAGETLVVTSAAGAVGSLTGQIGKIYGCRVIGVAGSDERCRWITDDLGFDAAINYRTENIDQRLSDLCPNGIDVYFDNVGGAMLDTILMHISIGARISLCGMLTNYNAPAEAAINNLFQLILKRASAHGFLVTDYLHRYTEAFEKLTAWEAEGKLKYNLTVVEGIEQAPQALANVFASRYLGKVVVQVSEEP